MPDKIVPSKVIQDLSVVNNADPKVPLISQQDDDEYENEEYEDVE